MKIQEMISFANIQLQNTDKELEAIKFLMCERLHMSHSTLYINYDQKIEPKVEKKLLKEIKLFINKNVPIQYILGYTYFFGLKIGVNKHVLIPRFETEELVEKALEYIPLDAQYRIIDVGTGSGAIALAIKSNRTKCSIVGVDIVKKTLKQARKNAHDLNLEVTFQESDVLSWAKDNSKTFDVIISNPPYIDIANPAEEIVHKNEPHIALYAEDKGLKIYKTILDESIDVLSEKGVILFEIPYDKAEDLKAYANQKLPTKEVIILKDMQNKDRIMIIK